MPTKSIIDNLYIFDAETGEKYKLEHIKDIELTASDSQEAEKHFNLKPMESFSVTIDVRQSLVCQLYVMIGDKFRVPNNWLKRHKIPMNRRKAYGKVKSNHQKYVR